MIAERAIHVVEVGEIMVLDIAVEARVLLAERVLRVERVVAPVLFRDERDHVGAACGNAVAMVDADAVLKHAVHHARTVDRAETAAGVDHCRPVSHMRPVLSPFVPFAGFNRLYAVYRNIRAQRSSSDCANCAICAEVSELASSIPPSASSGESLPNDSSTTPRWRTVPSLPSMIAAVSGNSSRK